MLRPLRSFRTHFWRRPDATAGSHGHGHIEHFYDLVFVVLIAEGVHILSEHLDREGLERFTVVFVWIWILWLNGTLSHELHSRDDGRSRTSLLLQMLLLVLLASFTAHAPDDSGASFAVVAALILLAQAYRWLRSSPMPGRAAAERGDRALGIASIVAALGFIATVPLSNDARLVVWLVMAMALIGVPILIERFDSLALQLSDHGEYRMVERFGLITIIALGEVVFGVVSGLRGSDNGLEPTLTAMLGLWVGFALWWNFFDFVGKRSPLPGHTGLWIVLHLPLVMSIGVIGAATISFVETNDAEAEPIRFVQWLFAGSVALCLATIVAMDLTTIVVHEASRVRVVFLTSCLLGVVALGTIGWFALSPLIALGVAVLVLIAVWLSTMQAWIDEGERRETQPAQI